MSAELTLRWAVEEDLDRVAETRLLSFGSARKDLETIKTRMRAEKRVGPEDWLLAERDGEAIGTATSFSFHMWVRGGRIACQGVGDVGTIKTARRAGLLPSGRRAPGVATTIMNELIRKAREREQVVSALLPFRASFYEHFGYGMVERRHLWSLPLSILPSGSTEGMRFYRSDDLHELARCRQRIAEAGQCDIERSPEGWEKFISTIDDGLLIVDRPDPQGPVQGWMMMVREEHEGKRVVRVRDRGGESAEAFARQLYLLGSLRDQYESALLLLPNDWPVHWLLRETHIAPITSQARRAGIIPSSRMQIRVLDHKRLLETIRWPAEARGKAVVAVQEPEGEVSTFEIDVSDGRAAVKPSGSTAQVECPATVWAAITCGDLPATRAAGFGLLSAGEPEALKLLDALTIGPAPFCGESF